jgi:chorismate synthase
MIVNNHDSENWDKKVTAPRPGHADLAGALKYGFDDIRNVIERASARETVMRVAVGAVCKKFLREFDIQITSCIIQIGNMITSARPSKSFILSMEKLIVEAAKKKDTLGGVIEVMAKKVPPGLGSYTHWDRRLDGRLAHHLMTIPSVKAVEIGEGIAASSKFGSEVHDEIFYKDGKFVRKTNRAGGIEGGISNGEDIIIRVFHKPIPTLGKPLRTVDINTKKPTKALIERSDICAVPRAGVISESAIAFVLADCILEKFGGDSLKETKRNFYSYIKFLS